MENKNKNKSFMIPLLTLPDCHTIKPLPDLHEGRLTPEYKCDGCRPYVVVMGPDGPFIYSPFGIFAD